MKTIQRARFCLCALALILPSLLSSAAFAQKMQPLQPAAPLKFQGRYYPTPFTVSFADFLNPNDPINPGRSGWPSILGAPNNMTGMLSVPSMDWTQVVASVGLSDLFGSRAYRMTAVADFNGDGILDIIANSYSKATDPESHLELYFGQPDGTFVRDTSNQALFSQIRGHGETILVADFNNDGFLDVFLPCYTMPNPNPGQPNAAHMSLLLNDGTGHFIDATAIDEVDGTGAHHSVDEAGVGCAFDPNSPYAALTIDGIISGTQNRYLYWQPEGAQAVDFNQDGKIDFYAGSRLFINQGNRPISVGGRIWQVPRFLDKAAAYGLVDLDRTRLAPGQRFHTNTGAFNQWAYNHSYGSVGGAISYLDAFGPMFFDEGAKFLDWNNDGSLDLVLDEPGWGPALFEFNAQTQKFVWRQWTYLGDKRVPFFNSGPPNYSEIVPFSNGNFIPAPGNDGINVYDLDNDGFEDILTGGSVSSPQYTNWTFRNMGYGFEWMHGYETAGTYGGAPVSLFGPVNMGEGLGTMAFADINGDGLIDVAYPQGFGVMAFINKTPTKNRSFTIEIVGPNGEKNQQGRVVTVTRDRTRDRGTTGPSPTYTRVVESGSGYQTQNQYGILLALPDAGQGPLSQGYKVTVVFANARFGTTFYPGYLPADNRNGLRIYAPSSRYPFGRSELYRLHPPAAVPDTPTDTVGVFRPSEYDFYLNNTNSPRFAHTQLGFSTPTGFPAVGTPANGVTALAGDWTGTGTSAPGLYLASKNTFYLRNSNTSGASDITTLFIPELDDIPLAGDWTGQGFETVGVYRKREHTFYLRSSHSTGEADIIVAPMAPDANGNPAPPQDDDIPIAGDWDGDHVTTIGLFRPRTQIFYLYNANRSDSGFVTTWIADPNVSQGGGHAQLFLASDAHPLVGDWNGDGKSKIGLYSGSFYFGLPIPGESGMAAHIVTPAFVEDGDVPIVGDWDNSGVTSYGFYRPGGSLFILWTGGSLNAFRYGEITNNDGFSFLGTPFIAPILFGATFVDVPIIGKWAAGHGSLVGVYQVHNRAFALRTDNSAGIGDLFYTYAPNVSSSDIPIVGDWLGRGTTTLGAYRSSNRSFYLSNSNTQQNADMQASITDLSFPPNTLDGIPVVGDWDGNGSTTIGLYDPVGKAFYLRNTNTTGPYDIKVDVSGFAQPGDIPIAGNWASSLMGDPLINGVDTLGLYRPATAEWYLCTQPMAPNASRVFVPTGVYGFRYGAIGDFPVTGHWVP